ncbi:hypothetical protein PLESTB_000870900 [Pleodorina starrii]|uniref:Uncharacterized protein n=1 Tax=Pleodorina starrii TaxID=330485 RepID=A0A9W6BMI0_9CHLO|nr:hypothetical protein PLESTM_002029700 [Pleodorina starrii]GLC54475.1 hypothetical protein PLESTB_000870900 [Pleodorina starrii]
MHHGVPFPPWGDFNLSDLKERIHDNAAAAKAAATSHARLSTAIGTAAAAVDASAEVPVFTYPPTAYKCLESRQALLGKVMYVVGAEQPGSPTDPAVLFTMRCLNEREFVVRVRSTTAFVPLTLFDGEPRGAYPNSKATTHASDMTPEKIMTDVERFLLPGLFVMVEGVAFETGRMDATTIYNLYDFSGNKATEEQHLVFEEPDWWRDQITELSDAWLRGMFKTADEVDWSLYRTNLGITFGPVEGLADQEVATLSRLIYGLASAYHLTGNMRFLDAAASGVEYQRKNFKLQDVDGKNTLWTAARNGRRFQLTSTAGDDRGTIPLYEQIYALAGLAQYYRITLDPEVLAEIKGTVRAFKTYYYDESEHKGFFSHIDFATKSPFAESLNATNNLGKKNWNSIGDHIPAYLINTIIALENGADPEFRSECVDILRECTRLIVDKFVINGLQHAESGGSMSLVPERFYADWRFDTTHNWQQNRGIVGHNLKIVWNLHRVANFLAAGIDPELARDAANAADALLQRLLQEGGVDGFRGGCFDALERRPGCGSLTFCWLNTKDFWQQEQAILALLMSYGATRRPEYLDHARAAQAFYNTFFLNKDQESVYFRTDADGSSITDGVYGQQASHAKSGYHTHENAFLTFLYNNAFVSRAEFCLYFCPSDKTSETRLSVLPDFLAPDAIKVNHVEAVNFPHVAASPILSGRGDSALLLELPPKVRGSPIQVRYKAGADAPKLAPEPLKRVPVPVPIQPAAASTSSGGDGVMPTFQKKIGILVETHYVADEIRYWGEILNSRGYKVEYLSNLKQWGISQNTFYDNDYRTPLVVSNDFQQYINNPQLLHDQGFKGFLLCAGYAMDRLRFDPCRKRGQPNNSVAVQFLKAIDADPGFVIGGSCHSMWLYCACPDLIKGREVTCASNIVEDVENAGGKVMYVLDGPGGLAVAHVDCSEAGAGRATLVTGTGLAHVGSAFMSLFMKKLKEMEDSGQK